jgi:DNA-binding CsgD family transcriptional regulator
MLDRAPWCPILIGREQYVDLLRESLEQAHARHGSTLLLSGEAGIGKSRLLREAKSIAEQVGMRVVQGACFEPDRHAPYAVLLDLVPELAPLVSSAPAHAARHLAQATLSLLGSEPHLLIVEDVHWSDEASLDVLFQMARRIRDLPILLVLSYRADEVQPALSHFLAELERERLATEVRLQPLSAADVLSMLRCIFDLPRSIHPELGEAMYSLTEGNPFFVEEVLGSLATSGDIFYAEGRWNRRPLDELRIPRTIQDAVGRRMAQLSSAAQRTLALAAIIGRDFDFSLLQALTGSAEAELLDYLRELTAAQLIVEVEADRFAFRHALTRQAVVSQLLGRERRALHQRLAETLEQQQAAVEDLAAHFAAAAVWDKAHLYAQRAAERAGKLHAPRAEVEQLSRVLEAAAHLGQRPEPAVLLARGEAHAQLGHFEDARQDDEAALERARATGHRQQEWQALVALGALWAERDYDHTGDYYQRALELARTIGDASLIARGLNRLGNWHQNAGRPADALIQHREALAIFQAAADRHGIAQTLDYMATANSIAGDLPAARAEYEQAIALLRELDEPQAVSSALAMLPILRGSAFHDTVPTCDLPLVEALAFHDDALRLARSIDWHAGEAFALISVGLALGHVGEYGRALTCVRKGRALALDIEHRQWTACSDISLGALHLQLLDVPTARQHIEAGLREAREIRSGHWTDLATGLLISSYVGEGNAETAAALLREVFHADSPPTTRPQRLIWTAATELALLRAEPRAALALLERLLEVTPNLAAGQVVPRLWWLRGKALHLLNDLPAAEAAFDAARSAAAAQVARPQLWRIELSLATVHRARADRHAADASLARARALVEQLADSLEDPTLAQTFRDAALAGQPSHTSRSAAIGGLSPREQQVAALVARGMTNREIADQLVIAEHTAERHVENILAKLSLRSRVQIAAWAVEHALPGR